MRQIAVIAVLCLGPFTPAWAEGPSFECGEASTAVKKAICASSRLSALDRKVYEESASAEATDQISFKDVLDWWREQETACAPANTEECLFRLFTERHAFLSQFPRAPDEFHENEGGGGTIVVNGEQHPVSLIRDPAEIAERMTDFNRSASRLNDARRITTCDSVVDVRAGTQNHLYAGHCSLTEDGQVKNAIVCNAAMVAHFIVQELGDKKPTAKDMAAFAARYCSPA